MGQIGRIIAATVTLAALSVSFAPAARAWPNTVYKQANYLPPVVQKPSVVDSVSHINRVTTETDEIDCYDADTYVLLNCRFDYTILGTADQLHPDGYNDIGYPTDLANGGHYHANDRPLAYPDNGNVLTMLGGLLKSTGYNTLTGYTFNQDILVNYPLPQAAGVIAVVLNIYVPDGYYCVDICWDTQTNRYIEAIANGYYQQGSTTYLLEDMTLPPRATYQFVGNDGGHIDPVNHHPLGDFLTNAAATRFLNIANFYVQKTGGGLSINDMSLPAGGIFDYNQTWHPPHDTHRDGVAVDVNRTDLNLVFTECQNNYWLRKAVENVVGYNTSRGEPYHCEKQKNLDGSPAYDDNGDLIEKIHINLFPQPRQ